ncbi:hypothetical protein H1P_1030019 [Hyella patelloides LEGE 07179]|uniref:Uncharacterized protein n=1 Tax=Hyella patelloides LEGE 07179 TaxID=945734 RepID=A0A563VJ03_9CYAN|nr:hypothetical protein H1P_1030019 [Hyella patelloides LEGE 07179]
MILVFLEFFSTGNSKEREKILKAIKTNAIAWNKRKGNISKDSLTF